jgi:RNA polymerase sigma factor (sigma-70 family)
MTEVTDETIAKAVQAGDGIAYGELIVRYEPKLKRYARKFLSRAEDVEDLVQDVFIKAYEHIQSFDSSLRFSPWIYRIAHNVFVNELRRKSRYGFGVFDADVILPLLPASETADGEVLGDELRSVLDTQLEKLSPKYREVLVLHYFEGLSYQEISEVLKIPVNTVGVRMTRARAKLRDLMAK